MTDEETTDRVAALQRARVEIEMALSTNPDWLTFRRASAGSSRLLAERALAGNPLYRSWDLLSEAIRGLQAGGAGERGADAGRRPGSIELGDVLESIRNDAALRGAKLPSVVLDMGHGAAQPVLPGNVERPPAPLHAQDEPLAPVEDTPGSDEVDIAAVEPEEATVTFVIREPARPAPNPPREGGPPRAAPASSVAARLQTSPSGYGGEAEVKIVSGRKDRASRAASTKR